MTKLQLTEQLRQLERETARIRRKIWVITLKDALKKPREWPARVARRTPTHLRTSGELDGRNEQR